ncbi:flagellar assembly protein FliW [Kyrpidia sp.]|uniref:flagellar assembly protein FliW n=1 Tax=Kyrpidia sp. TaxID=2073077 RepID=UPI002584B267|nr:flagellar assembly protein FliW [Kyrpidia sp.]MCL6577739.1 flagellar assembly protein FliW [Kyrpidia sp.]
MATRCSHQEDDCPIGVAQNEPDARHFPVIEFAQGIPGFPETRFFSLQPVPEGEGWFHLVGVGEEAPTFLVVNPFLILPDYEVEVPDDLLSGARAQDIVLLAIVRVPDNPWEATVNLRAPLVIDVPRQRGVQCVPLESPYSIRHPLFPKGEAVGVPCSS